MKIALFGATGTIGQRILREALERGHQITAIVRDPSKLTETNPNVSSLKGDVLDAEKVAEAVKGHDVVVSSYAPSFDAPYKVVDASRSLIAGLSAAGVKRLVIVGGAGSLEVAPGVQLVDTPSFPKDWFAIADAHRDALSVFQNEGDELEWSYFSPAAFIEPGERTRNFRVGGTQLITDAEGNSRISAEDYAVALLDEIENPKYVKAQFTVGY